MAFSATGDRMSLSFPDDLVGFLDQPSGFCAKAKIEVLQFSPEREQNSYLLGLKEYFLINFLCG